jgi:hypothetical protein
MTKIETTKLARLVKNMTQKEALFAFLEQGYEFSAAEARKAGIADPSRVISSLRNDHGLAIYLNPRKTRTGERINRYRLGTPRKNG